MRFGEDTRLREKFDTEFLGVKRDAGGGSARLTGIPLLKGRLAAQQHGSRVVLRIG